MPSEIEAALVQNEKLHCELKEAQEAMQRQAEQVRRFEAQRSREASATKELQAVVEHLEERLVTATQHTRHLQEHVANLQGGLRARADARTPPFTPEKSAAGGAGSLSLRAAAAVRTRSRGSTPRAAGSQASSPEGRVRHGCSPAQGREGASGVHAELTNQSGESADSPKAASPKTEQAVEPSGVSPKANDSMWEFVVQGRLAGSGQPEASHKDLTCFPTGAPAHVQANGVAYQCARGRRMDPTAANQDDFLVAMCRCGDHAGRVALYGVFDGHGPAGHLCAAFTRGFLPERIFADPSLLARPAEVLRNAFQEAQESLMQQGFASGAPEVAEGAKRRTPASPSGTTATVALVLSQLPRCSSSNGHEELGTWVLVASVGDSRAILGSHRDNDGGSGSTCGGGAFATTALTREHRPSNEEECLRVAQEGGEVRKPSAGNGTSRVFVPGATYPALPLTRALGEAAAAGCGVSAEPEIVEHQVHPGKDVLLVLGTDGLFEFCSDGEVVERLLRSGVNSAALERLCAESRRRWAANSYNETVDDTTAIAVSLQRSSGAA